MSITESVVSQLKTVNNFYLTSIGNVLNIQRDRSVESTIHGNKTNLFISSPKGALQFVIWSNKANIPFKILGDPKVKKALESLGKSNFSTRISKRHTQDVTNYKPNGHKSYKIVLTEKKPPALKKEPKAFFSRAL